MVVDKTMAIILNDNCYIGRLFFVFNTLPRLWRCRELLSTRQQSTTQDFEKQNPVLQMQLSLKGDCSCCCPCGPQQKCANKRGSLNLLIFERAVKQGNYNCLRQIDRGWQGQKQHQCHCNDERGGGDEAVFLAGQRS